MIIPNFQGLYKLYTFNIWLQYNDFVFLSTAAAVVVAAVRTWLLRIAYILTDYTRYEGQVV